MNTIDIIPPATTVEQTAHTTIDATDLLTLVKNTLDQKNASDIVIIDLEGKSDMADYMIIASGNNTTHVGALSEHVTRTLKDHNILAQIEGRPQNEWVLVDCPYIVTHIFKPETREIYHLEKMWSM